MQTQPRAPFVAAALALAAASSGACRGDLDVGGVRRPGTDAAAPFDGAITAGPDARVAGGDAGGTPPGPVDARGAAPTHDAPGSPLSPAPLGQQRSLVAPRLARFLDGAVNAGVAWVVGSHGAVLRSTDGGARWEDRSAPVYKTLYAVAPVSADAAFVVGEGGTLLATADGGASWRPIALPVAETFVAASFREAAEGVIASVQGTILRVRDGRTIETLQASAGASTPSGLRTALAVHHFSSGSILATDGLTASRSEDGGRSWSTAKIPWTTTLLSSGYRLQLVNESLGFVYGGSRALARTRDGGRTWEEIASALTSADAGLFVNDMVGYLVDSGSLLVTEDGARSFAPVSLPQELRSSVTAMATFGDGRVLLVGELGAVGIGANLGRSWTPAIAEPARGALRDLAFFDDRTGVGVGRGGILHVTLDGGRGWRELGGLVCSRPQAAQILPSGRLATAAEDKICFSDDLAKTWESRLATGEGLHAGRFAFRDDERGVVATRLGPKVEPGARRAALLLTTDGGRSFREVWTRRPADATAPVAQIHDVHWAGAERVWAVGAPGLLLVSSDAGASFREIAHPALRRMGAILHAARSSGGRTGFLVGGSGLLLRTRDGGETWEELPLGIDKEADPKRNLFSLWASGRTVLVGEGGYGARWSGGRRYATRSFLFRSDDEGASFAPVEDFATEGIDAIWIARSGRVWLSDGSGNVLSTHP